MFANNIMFSQISLELADVLVVKCQVSNSQLLLLPAPPAIYGKHSIKQNNKNIPTYVHPKNLH